MKKFLVLWFFVYLSVMMLYSGTLILKTGEKKEGFVTQRGLIYTLFTKDGRLFQFQKSDLKEVVKVDKVIPLGKDEKKVMEENIRNPVVLVKTTKGDFKIELFEDVAPNTVANFISLVEKGFYNNVMFHRVIPGFVAQVGDPNTRGERGKDFLMEDDIRKLKLQGKKIPNLPLAGTGDPGYTIKAEFNSTPHLRGTVAMARSQDPDSAGSQFYICLESQPHLDGKYTVFGKVIENGMEVVDKIKVGDRIKKIEILEKRNHPYIPQVMKKK